MIFFAPQLAKDCVVEKQSGKSASRCKGLHFSKRRGAFGLKKALLKSEAGNVTNQEYFC
jgi:hypothetical protein